jgi:hypothetical protein
MRAPTTTTLREAAHALVAGMKDGRVRTRSGDLYKPSVIRGYESVLALRVLNDLGALRLSEIHRADLQALADGLLAKGLDPSTIRNTLMPLRVIYRRAVEDGVVAVNPTEKLRLPGVRGRRDRIASPTEAATLLANLLDGDRRRRRDPRRAFLGRQGRCGRAEEQRRHTPGPDRVGAARLSDRAQAPVRSKRGPCLRPLAGAAVQSLLHRPAGRSRLAPRAGEASR